MHSYCVLLSLMGPYCSLLSYLSLEPRREIFFSKKHIAPDLVSSTKSGTAVQIWQRPPDLHKVIGKWRRKPFCHKRQILREMVTWGNPDRRSVRTASLPIPSSALKSDMAVRWRVDSHCVAFLTGVGRISPTHHEQGEQPKTKNTGIAS
jgi:hypothetical protein